MLIGGKGKKAAKATQPQFVVQKMLGINEYALFERDFEGELVIRWVGDPNAATKYNSKYEAKNRLREWELPETRCFHQV